MDGGAIAAVMIVLIILVVAAAIAIPVTLSVRAARIRRQISAFGWQVDPSRSLQRVTGLWLPPFDTGVRRTISEAIIGTTSDGTPFQAFSYRHQRPAFAAWIAMVTLPVPLPELYLSTDHGGHSRQGLRIPAHPVGERWASVLEVATADPAFADAVLTEPMLNTLAEWATQRPQGFDLAVDGANLVAIGSPTTKEPEELRAFVDRLARIAGLIDPERVAGFAIETKPPRLGVRGTDWVLTPEAPELVTRYRGIGPVGEGLRPTARDRFTGSHRGIGFEAFEYEWQTQHTRRDSDGGQHTYYQTHHAPVSMLLLPQPLPTLTIALGKQQWATQVGPVQALGIPGFDQRFDVWSTHPEFVRDVISDRLIDWLQRWSPPLIMINQGLIIAFPRQHSPGDLYASLDFLCAFCDLIEDHVWARMGIPRPGQAPTPQEPEGYAGASEPAGFVGEELR